MQDVPRLYVEDLVGERDRDVRDHFYGGVVGTYYRFLMPLLSLPVRPVAISLRQWLAFVLASAGCIALVAYVVDLVAWRRFDSFGPVDAIVLLATLLLAWFFNKHSYLFFLMLLAIPTRMALAFTKFRPDRSFRDLHADVIEGLKRNGRRLQVLDVATGSCASLYKHGWMELDADYTAVDLSQTMLLEGVRFMAQAGVEVDFALADACNLPFESETFDVVLNYGSINSVTDPGVALREMARVTKPGGLVLFMDEQLYAGASSVESAYFHRVLASHDTVDRCPVELLPAELSSVMVSQVYHFYYICTATRAAAVVAT